jgi:hypothetical protein
MRTTRRWWWTLSLVLAASALGACGSTADDEEEDDNGSVDAACPALPETPDAGPMDPVAQSASTLIEAGRHTFRFDTFGDEAFWGTQLQLHRAIAGEANGGVGGGLSPSAALDLGLKVDADAIPADLAAQITAGTVDLESPATTLALLRIHAVVGVEGFFADDGSLESVGIECALCHSTVDDSFAPGIGHRLDGWPNRDLDVGQIIALSPNLGPVTQLLGADDATVRQVLRSWGPGRFDAELILDGRATRPDGGNASTLLPAAFGLSGVNLHTYTGWGSVTYWNAFVSNLEMHGVGTFYDPRLDDASRFPIAARARLGHVQTPPGEDRITPHLAELHFYQLALPIPTPPANSFDAAAAARGRIVFEGAGQCASCHVPPLYTEPGWNMHTAQEIGIDDFQAQRSPDQRYRTTPLRGLFTRMRGGFYHDGRFQTLDAVVAHYVEHFELSLDASQRSDLVEFLKSL